MTADERQQRLAPIVERYRNAPFAWSEHDCALFAARCVDAQLATRFEANIQRDYRYSEPAAALLIIKAAGGWEPIISRYLGPSVPPAELEFGDVVLAHAPAPYERTFLLGICDEERFMAPDTLGLAWVPMQNAVMGWSLKNIAAQQLAVLNRHVERIRIGR
jgi:hypothetical protein